MASLTSDLSDPRDIGQTLKPAQIAILAAFSTCVWFLAAMFIRFVGPMGIFHGYKVIALYALTVPATVPHAISLCGRRCANLRSFAQASRTLGSSTA